MLRRPVEPAQYVSIAATQRLIDEGIDPSVGSVGDALDNALAETTVGSFKNELIRRHGPWRDAHHVEVETLQSVHWFNTERAARVPRRPHPRAGREASLRSASPGSRRVTQLSESPDTPGGLNTGDPICSVTDLAWTWSGSSWTEQQIVGPPVRYASSVAASAGPATVVMFGGWKPDSGYTDENWTLIAGSSPSISPVVPPNTGVTVTHGTFEYYRMSSADAQSTCVEIGTSGVLTDCSIDNFYSIVPPYGIPLFLMDVGRIRAAVVVTSPVLGEPVTVQGDFVMAGGTGQFVGSTTVGEFTVAVHATAVHAPTSRESRLAGSYNIIRRI